jgi:uncharacterized protein YbjT (DUF2867 family)
MIVVTGATGNVGRPLVRLLGDAGEQVIAVSRRVTRADVPARARAVPADLANAPTLRPALEGADAVFLAPAGDLLASAGSPGGLIEVIKQSGVRRVVLLSSQASHTRPQAISHARLRDFEHAVTTSRLNWTVLRPGGFASNTFAYIPSIRTARTVAAPFGDVGLPLIDPAEVAEVAAAALRDDRHAGQTYVLTGPSLVSPRQQAAALGTALGAELHFTELTRDQALTTMVQFMPEPVAQGTLDILGAPTQEEQSISPDAEKILGRAPRTFAEWAQRNIAAFR